MSNLTPYLSLRSVLRAAAAAAYLCFLQPSGLAQLLGHVPPPAIGHDLKDEVFYQLMPIAWRSGHGGIDGDFQGMTDSLPYLKGLGVTAVWMTPIFPSPAYHGYQYSTADQLNPRFGTEEEWRAFVHAAHAKQIKVFIDFVAYGVGGQSPYFADAFGNPSSTYSDMFKWYDVGHTNFEGYSYPTWNGDTVTFAWWNMNDPRPGLIEQQWAMKWLNPAYGIYKDAGVDGYRCDHTVVSFDAYGPNGLGYTTANFWTPFKAAVKAQYPNLILFGEQGDWSLYGNTFMPPFDAMFTKPLEFAVRDTLNSENKTAFMNTIASTVASLGPTGTYLGTFGDHDVDRLTSSLGDNLDKAKLAAGILMAQPYAPIIYNGDEIGMRGFKSNAYNSDANDIPNREPFKWNAVAGAPMSNYYSVNTDVFNARYEHDNDGRSVQEEQGVPGSLLETYRKLIQVRRNFWALRHGAYAPISNPSTGVISFLRKSGPSGIVAVFNLTGGAVTTNIDVSGQGFVGNVYDVLIPSPWATPLTPISNANQSAYPVTLPPYGMRYLLAGAPVSQH